ncbi:MAG: hypothetical protein PHI31_06650 [Desulfuromonadaceae bacterium]|nr:hypothetical protein [Desulfuromonadaceae bacterium]
MIFHCTKALAVKLPEVSKAPLADNNPIGSWHAHLHVIDRRRCVMFCHDTTRFILFQAGLKKEQFHRLGQLHRELFRFTLVSMGVPDSSIKRVELAMGPATFDTATDRSVLGTLNQSRSDFDHFINDYRNILEVDPVIAARWLNHRPLTARGTWLWPDKSMLELVGKL